MKTQKHVKSAKDRIVQDILQLLHQSFDDSSVLEYPDGGVHVAIAVLDLLKLIVEDGDKFVDLLIKIRGAKIMGKEYHNEKIKYEKEYHQYLDGVYVEEKK